MPGRLTSYRAALVDRLSGEWVDADLATAIVGAAPDDAVEQWMDRVPASEVATSELLTYLHDPSPAPVDALLVYAFGHRGPDGDRIPGPVNEAMARAVRTHLTDHPMAVFAQFEGGEALRALGVDAVRTVPLARRSDGSVIYQSTIDFTDEVGRMATADGRAVRRVGVVAFADHLGRCLLTARVAGFDAVRVDGIDLPHTYDLGSTQPWTRDRAAYLAMDLAVRLA